MVLFYALETWTLKTPQLHRLEVFHDHCIRVILGVSRDQQWQERISSEELARRFGMPSSMAEIVRCHRLRWLGNLGQMEDSRLPKRVLFAEGLNTRSRHGPKKRWRDFAAADLSARCMTGDWWDLAQDRRDWRLMCNRPRPAEPKPRVFICGCGKDFRRPNDLTRHRKYCKS